MKKNFYSVLVLAFFVLGVSKNANSQVTIGEIATPNTTLDVRGQAENTTIADGILTPKLTGDQLAAKIAYGEAQNGALVYVTSAASPENQIGETVNVKAPGYYYYFYDSDSGVWIALAKEKPEWFYMPPSLINVEVGIEKTIDLYSEYSESITTGSIKSGGADFSTICLTDSRSDYDYYVVGYDENIFDNISISPAGVMTYDIVKEATDESYINIVFVRK